MDKEERLLFEQRVDAFHKVLLKFTKKDDLVHLGQRLLQKVPECQKELDEIIENSGSSDLVPFVREYLMRVAKEATSEDFPQHLKPLPRSLEKYVAYCDILYRVLHLDAYNWQTLVLSDYNAGIHNTSFDFHEVPSQKDQEDPVFVEDMQKQVKKALKKTGKFGFVSSLCEVSQNVMTDFEVGPGGEESCEAVVLRVATVPANDKLDKSQLEIKVMKKAPTYYVYVPGEPYLYASTSEPCPDTCQAVVRFLKCSGYSAVPLVGKDLSSLRQLRISRDKNVCREPEEMSVEGFFGGGALPKLERFTVDATSTFRTKSVAESHDIIKPGGGEADALHHREALAELNNTTVPPEGEAFTCKAVFTGPDVLRGFESLCSNGFFLKPYPNWMIQAPYRGRNYAKIRQKAAAAAAPASQRASSQSSAAIAAGANDDDVMSVAASDMTTAIR